MPADTIAPADLADLRGSAFATLDVAFENGTEPDMPELDGAYGGRLVAFRGLDALPSLVRGPLNAILTSALVPWRGKRFSGDTEGNRFGTNIWLTMFGPDFTHFDVSQAASALQLDYNIPRNLPPIRSIRGEVRRLAPGLYLGRMSLQIRGQRTPLLYFTLDNA